jgi:glutamine---fructose-6-phosphate transaminase (isomerizing)
MCGIFGFVAAPGQALDPSAVRSIVESLFHLSEPRGREASGLVLVADGVAEVHKRPLQPSLMLRTPEYDRFVREGISRIGRDDSGRLVRPVAALGHCRLATNGAQSTPGNNQPIVADHTIGVHNGIIVNDESLWRSHPELTRRYRSDTEIVVRLVDSHANGRADLAQALRATFSELVGTASVALLRDDANALLLATNNGSLYTADLGGAFVFASERFILRSFLDQRHGLGTLPSPTIEQLAPGSACIVSLETARPVRFRMGDDQPAAPLPAETRLVIREVRSIRGVLRRCTRCILPVTYPFITFDADGVCNYCRDHRPAPLAGRAALEVELAKHRRSDGKPDCVVAFSGGRDSSYGLHLLKTELGMNPIAYSYDWGMVTDLARRNQARMCGKLQVEHILRAANIPAKRRYMRKNILAWLRRPRLGMVPLFMAGDKYFYGIGRQLRKELGIPLVIFCAGNPLERTDFKGGFAGIRESQHGQRLFAFSMANKLQIAAYYALNYLLNPAYLNESMIDSFGSFYTTFVGRDDFLYLYHYLPWDEATINRTLIGEYGWETASHTENTWRIGDGYTSFINHIYYSVAGFSEFDAFRSQQIRAELMTRQEALARVVEDNQPDRAILDEFAAQVGLNLEEVLSGIDLIPKLY